MKKVFKFLLLLIIPFTFTVCTSESDSISDDSIVGTWKGIAYDDNCYWSFSFKSNGKFTWNYWDIDDESDAGYTIGTYKYDSSNDMLRLYITEDEDEVYNDPEIATFDCTIKGNKMTLQDGYWSITLTKQ